MQWLRAILTGVAVVCLQAAALPAGWPAAKEASQPACCCPKCSGPAACCCQAGPDANAPLPVAPSTSNPSSMDPAGLAAGNTSVLPRTSFSRLPDLPMPAPRAAAMPLFARNCARLI